MKKMLKLVTSILLFFICLKLIYAKKKCESDIECNYGECVSFTCMCYSGYVDYQNTICIYKQKEKIFAFLLSFIIGSLGADWFYLANGNVAFLIIGIIKSLVGIFFIISICFHRFTFICAKKFISSSKQKAILQSFVYFYGILNTLFWFVDWFRILVDATKDGNGVSLRLL